ncbi:hypothetical protein PybrP1_011078 [[Pythium] brassicae (nom. inval.)]|nr:hypothetical protein PybrP1_011078 [[Pythium] brassicae (nom. inval.)]
MRLPDEAMPTLYLTRDEELAVEREASAVVMETAAAFEAFVAGGRAFPKHQWKQVKERASFRVYRSRRSFAAMDAAPPAYLSSAQGSVFSRTAKLSKAPKTTPSSSSETSGSGPGGGTAHPRVSAGGDDAAAPEDPGRCPGCQRALRRFGGLGRAAVVACWCCRRSVCAKCASERKLVVDVAPDGALTQRTLSFCIARTSTSAT